MSIENEIRIQTQAIQELTEAIHAMTVTNQKVLDVLIEVMAGDDPDSQPMRDMEGNPV